MSDLRKDGEFMTKEPNKDFRQALFEVLTGRTPPRTVDQITNEVIALCKEMLVEGRREPRWSVGKDLNEGWNAYNDSLLKQLGEK